VRSFLLSLPLCLSLFSHVLSLSLCPTLILSIPLFFRPVFSSSPHVDLSLESLLWICSFFNVADLRFHFFLSLFWTFGDYFTSIILFRELFSLLSSSCHSLPLRYLRYLYASCFSSRISFYCWVFISLSLSSFHVFVSTFLFSRLSLFLRLNYIFHSVSIIRREYFILSFIFYNFLRALLITSLHFRQIYICYPLSSVFFPFFSSTLQQSSYYAYL